MSKLQTKSILMQFIIAVYFLVLVTGCNTASSSIESEKSVSDNFAIESLNDEIEVKVNPNRRLLTPAEIKGVKSRADWGHYFDESGDVEIAIWESYSYGTHLEVHCDVDPSFVLIGGGAWADYDGTRVPNGVFLTASYPRDQELSSWVARSKGHQPTGTPAHKLVCYAIGLRLKGVSRSALRNQMKYVANTSGSSLFPNTTATLPANYSLIGGGSRVNYAGAPYGGTGNLLIASYPYNDQTWKSESKTHYYNCTASITSFAIGITNNTIPNFGRLKVERRSPSSIYNSCCLGTASTQIEPGYVPSCFGGESRANTATGRLLNRMSPNPNNVMNVLVSSKDCLISEGGVTLAHSIQIKKQ